MGYSLREREVMKRRAQEKHERRERQQTEHAKALAQFQESYWDRHRTAGALGISIHRLKRLQAEGRGPTALKMGPTPQSRTYWEAADVREYLRDPRGYEARKRDPGNGN